MDLIKCHRRCSRFQLAFLLVLIIYSEVSNVSAESDPCSPNNPCRYEGEGCHIEEGVKLNEIKCYKCVVLEKQGDDINKCQVVKENQLETCKRLDTVCTIYFGNNTVSTRGCKSRKCANGYLHSLGENDYFMCNTDKCNDKSKREDYKTTTTTTSTAKMTPTTAKMNSNVGRLDLNVGLLIGLLLFGISLWFGHHEVMIGHRKIFNVNF